MMANKVNPSFYDSDIRKTRRMVSGQEVIKPSLFPVDPKDTNILSVTTDGLLAEQNPSDFIGSADNGIDLDLAGKLRVNLNSLLSTEAKNIIKLSFIDGKLYATVQDLLPEDMLGSGLEIDANGLLKVNISDLVDPNSNNKLVISSGDKLGVYVNNLIDNVTVKENYNTGKIYVDPKQLISLDAGNNLHLSPDGKLYANVAEVSASDQVLKSETDGLRAYVDIGFNTTTDLLTLYGKDGQVINEVSLAFGVLGFKSITLEENPAGQPAGTYMVIVYTTDSGDQTTYIDMTKFITLYTASNGGVTVSDFRIGAKVNASQGLNITSAGIGFATGYQLMTKTQSDKLAGIEAGAEANVVTSVANKTGDVALVKGDVGLGNVDNTADINKPISTATKTALDAKQATITGAATTIDTENLTASRVLVSDGSGKVAVSPVTATELGYIDGVTANVQTQINALNSKTADLLIKAPDTLTIYVTTTGNNSNDGLTLATAVRDFTGVNTVLKKYNKEDCAINIIIGSGTWAAPSISGTLAGVRAAAVTVGRFYIEGAADGSTILSGQFEVSGLVLFLSNLTYTHTATMLHPIDGAHVVLFNQQRFIGQGTSAIGINIGSSTVRVNKSVRFFFEGTFSRGFAAYEGSAFDDISGDVYNFVDNPTFADSVFWCANGGIINLEGINATSFQGAFTGNNYNVALGSMLTNITAKDLNTFMKGSRSGGITSVDTVIAAYMVQRVATNCYIDADNGDDNWDGLDVTRPKKTWNNLWLNYLSLVNSRNLPITVNIKGLQQGDCNIYCNGMGQGGNFWIVGSDPATDGFTGTLRNVGATINIRGIQVNYIMDYFGGVYFAGTAALPVRFVGRSGGSSLAYWSGVAQSPGNGSYIQFTGPYTNSLFASSSLLAFENLHCSVVGTCTTPYIFSDEGSFFYYTGDFTGTITGLAATAKRVVLSSSIYLGVPLPGGNTIVENTPGSFVGLRIPGVMSSTVDLEAGVSTLADGVLYLVYE